MGGRGYGGRDVARILKGEGELLGGRCVPQRREKLLRGTGGFPSREILKSRVSETPLPEFWGKILQNSEG